MDSSWPRPPRSPNGRLMSDTAGFHPLDQGAFLRGNGHFSDSLELGGPRLPPDSLSLGGSLGLHLPQPPPLPISPPLPPPFQHELNPHTALYHVPYQSERQEHQEHQNQPDFSAGFNSFPSLRDVDVGTFASSIEYGKRPGASDTAFDVVSTGISQLHVGTNILHHHQNTNLQPIPTKTSDFGAIGRTSPRPSLASCSSTSLRDEMNAQMAALYQQSKPEPSLFSSQSQPLASSGHDLLKKLQKETSSSSSSSSSSQLGPLTGPRPFVSPCPSARSSTPSRVRQKSPSKSPRLERETHPPTSRSSPGQGNAIHVSPDVTKANENLKVQVSLKADDCVPGRVVLVGLFRLSQALNDKPIFVKQVLFENKLQRHYRYLNTRITFRAPRSPGEFEFRVFEDKSGHSPLRNGKRSNLAHDELPHGRSMASSNVILARSNRLKVCLEYSHFIETLRATYEKFQQGVVEGDAGLVLSALLALQRLVDQVEAVFLHGHALLGDLVDACLRLLARSASDIAQSFPATETIPQPIETFHGTLRNVLNAIETNPNVRELVGDEQLAEMARIQRERFCQVTGRYFLDDDARCEVWLDQFGFAPIQATASNEATRLHTTPFVTRAFTAWIEREAADLMPDRAAFRASRQAIYDHVQATVIAKLSFPCDLDVFGSSANDFGTDQSDLDMCLVLPETESPSIERKQRLLLEAVSLLEARPDLFTSIDTTRLSARIPIIMFVSRASNLECDLCVENRLAQRNTALLRAYASADPRVRVLAFVLKQFVKQRRMNCAAEGTLSSYGYLLLLIHFLQRQEPPVLPVLQALGPNWPEETGEKQLPSVLCRGPSDDVDPSASQGGIDTYFFDPFACRDASAKVAALRAFGARNTATVGELLVGFWRYYGLDFDASREVVSIRVPKAKTLTKDEKRQTMQWRVTTRLSVEDPFEVSYDVAHVLKGSRDKYIRQQFVRAYVLLLDGAIQAEADNEKEEEGDGEEEAHQAVARIMAIVNESARDVPFLSS